MDKQQHWQQVYENKDPNEVSWYRLHLDTSMRFLQGTKLKAGARIVDVGGGASTLVDDLVDAGFENIAVIDLAEAALARSQSRLPDHQAIDWMVGDVTTPLLPSDSVDFWHDRAVFHFLVEEADRQAYAKRITEAVKVWGHALVATFGPDGPEKCSGLPVRRHSAGEIATALGRGFEMIDSATEVHETPWGSAQSFAYCLCRRK